MQTHGEHPNYIQKDSGSNRGTEGPLLSIMSPWCPRPSMFYCCERTTTQPVCAVMWNSHHLGIICTNFCGQWESGLRTREMNSIPGLTNYTYMAGSSRWQLSAWAVLPGKSQPCVSGYIVGSALLNIQTWLTMLWNLNDSGFKWVINWWAAAVKARPAPSPLNRISPSWNGERSRNHSSSQGTSRDVCGCNIQRQLGG